MKYLKIITMGLLLSITFSTQLSAKDSPKFGKKVRKKVTNKMDFPKNSLEGKVGTEFCVSNDGTLFVFGVQSKNKELQEFVKEQLNSMKLNIDSIETQRVFTLDFVFKKENTK